MKRGKATGPDGAPAEFITALENIGITETTKLMNIIYDTREIPVDMRQSIFIALPKKPGTTDFAQHRAISLMSHLTIILLHIIMNRIRGRVKSEIAQTQFGFVSDKGTRNAVFTLQTLVERSVEFQKELYLHLTDYAKAFEKVKHVDLFKILAQLNLDGKDLRILQNHYWEHKAALMIIHQFQASM